MKAIAILAACIVLITHPLSVKAEVPFEAIPVEERAIMADMSLDDFVLISSVVEAESNRSTDGDLTGRVYICLVILNRVNDSRFPNTIRSVLTAPGQFSTVRNGRSVVSRTDYSDQAVIEAVAMLEAGDVPNVLFFNCRGFNYGTPFRLYEDSDTIGGNYFMTLEG